jgi:SAM-dependent methyltransferase
MTDTFNSPPASDDPVASSYNVNPAREWNRLAQDAYHELEFLITWHHLRQHLPPTGLILDAGGGPGRYSLELCRAGYQVILLDLSDGNVAYARQQFAAEPLEVQSRLLDAMVGNVCNLSRFQDNVFAAVLSLGGVLTHIPEASGRQLAMQELARVARPGGLVAISGIGLLAVLRTILMEFSEEILWPNWADFYRTGDSFGATHSVWHFYRAAELRQFAESCGLDTLAMAGCQGLSSSLIEPTNRLSEEPEKWQRWLDLVLHTSSEPAVVDMAEHILYLGRKKAA